MWFFQLGFSMFLYSYLHSFCGCKITNKNHCVQIYFLADDRSCRKGGSRAGKTLGKTWVKCGENARENGIDNGRLGVGFDPVHKGWR